VHERVRVAVFGVVVGIAVIVGFSSAMPGIVPGIHVPASSRGSAPPGPNQVRSFLHPPGVVSTSVGQSSPAGPVSTLEVTSPNAQLAGWFGYSVALSGTTLVVGAPFETNSGKAGGGTAYVFNAKTGALISTLSSPHPQVYGEFGWCVAISGTTVVVGAPGERASGNASAGHAYLFNAKTGARTSSLNSPNPVTDGGFGTSVAIAGKIVVVGAGGETAANQSAAGHAYLFNASNGALLTTLTSPNAQSSGEFGVSVAISGTRVAVGAYTESVSGVPDSGHAYTFNATNGALIATFQSGNVQVSGYFGYTVAISGTTLIVGAPGESVAANYSAGHVYKLNALTGVLVWTLTSPHAQNGGYFGNALSIGGTSTIVGAPFETILKVTQAGLAYSYNTKTGVLNSTLVSTNSQAYGEFGNSVAVSGKTIVVGAPDQIAYALGDAGVAYIW